MKNKELIFLTRRKFSILKKSIFVVGTTKTSWDKEFEKKRFDAVKRSFFVGLCHASRVVNNSARHPKIKGSMEMFHPVNSLVVDKIWCLFS
jgi:hypothetical protein